MASELLNGRNGLFLKVVIGVLVTGLASSAVGMIKLYRDVGVLQADTQLERRLRTLEELAANIATDRDKRTVVIQQFRDDISELKHRLEQLERRR